MRPKTKDRVTTSVNLDRDILEVLRNEKLGSISDIINEMARYASGHGMLACPDCGCEFNMPTGRTTYYKKRIKNPLG